MNFLESITLSSNFLALETKVVNETGCLVAHLLLGFYPMALAY